MEGGRHRCSVRVHRAFTAWLLDYLLVELRATAISLDKKGGPRQLAAGLDALLGS